MKDRHQVAPYPLRLSADLKDQVTKAAFVMGRSFNSEVAARLTASFEDPSHEHLPETVRNAVEHEQEARGGTSEEALTRLVLAGQSQGGTILHLVVQKGMSMKEIREALQASEKVIPPEASVIFETR